MMTRKQRSAAAHKAWATRRAKPKMAQPEFELIAEVLRDLRSEPEPSIDRVAHVFATALAKTNKRFDAKRFMMATEEVCKLCGHPLSEHIPRGLNARGNWCARLSPNQAYKLARERGGSARAMYKLLIGSPVP